MNILFLVPRLDKASTRYRVLQFLSPLEKAGIHADVRAIPKQALKRWSLLRSTSRYDAVFIQKKLFNRFDFSLLKRSARYLLYDLDDAVMFKDDQDKNTGWQRQERRFALTARNVDHIITGNGYLADSSRPWNSHVTVIPTSIDMERYRPVDWTTKSSKEVVIGWIGSRGTLKYLRNMIPVLEQVGKLYPQVRLKIVADDFIDLQQIPVEKKLWRHDDEIEDLHSFDIGLMPLTDDAWTRGKCGFKILQCMGVGVPVVCSPVGANCEIVTDGQDGFYAADDGEWLSALGRLIEDRELRIGLGAVARRTIHERYSLNVNVQKLIDSLRRASAEVGQ